VVQPSVHGHDGVTHGRKMVAGGGGGGAWMWPARVVGGRW
jgi:hypothetical protein